MDFYPKEGNANRKPALAAIESGNPFVVPDGYFEELKGNILSRSAIDTSSDSESFFILPEDYFKELSAKLITTVALEKSADFKKNPFTVPENYFEELRKTSLDTIAGESKMSASQKTIRRIKLWPIYFAAASLAIVLGVGIFFNTQTKNIESQIAEVPAEDIVNYLQLYSDAGDASIIINNLDESEIDNIRNQIPEADIESYLELNL